MKGRSGHQWRGTQGCIESFFHVALRYSPRVVILCPFKWDQIYFADYFHGERWQEHQCDANQVLCGWLLLYFICLSVIIKAKKITNRGGYIPSEVAYPILACNSSVNRSRFFCLVFSLKSMVDSCTYRWWRTHILFPDDTFHLRYGTVFGSSKHLWFVIWVSCKNIWKTRSGPTQGQHMCQRGDIPSWSAPVFAPGHCMGRFALFVLGSTQNLHV